MIWGFTGTREGMTSRQTVGLFKLLREGDELHHGDSGKSDGQAAKLGRMRKCRLVAHPCTIVELRQYAAADVVHEPKPPLERNRDIVLEVSVLVAAPKSLTEELRSGTWATIRYARKRGLTVVILDP